METAKRVTIRYNHRIWSITENNKLSATSAAASNKDKNKIVINGLILKTLLLFLLIVFSLMLCSFIVSILLPASMQFNKKSLHQEKFIIYKK